MRNTPDHNAVGRLAKAQNERVSTSWFAARWGLSSWANQCLFGCGRAASVLGEKGLLDLDLADSYEVQTKVQLKPAERSLRVRFCWGPSATPAGSIRTGRGPRVSQDHEK